MTHSICSTRLITTQFIADSRTLILHFESGTFGSLELSRLEQLDFELSELSRTSSAHTIIVDLSALNGIGSGFLSTLGMFRDALSSAGKRLVLCGDQTGLIAQVGWSQRMNLKVDLDQALTDCVLFVSQKTDPTE